MVIIFQIILQCLLVTINETKPETLIRFLGHISETKKKEKPLLALPKLQELAVFVTLQQ
jgi:hypothetical protein